MSTGRRNAHNVKHAGSNPASATNFLIFNVREATVGCVAADCNPAHKKHRPFDSDRVHQFQRSRTVVGIQSCEKWRLGNKWDETHTAPHFYG